MAFIELFTLQRVWTDLTDDEFFWEPVPGCWSVRPRAESRTPDSIGSGDWVIEYDDAIASSAVTDEAHPMTTIAWNLAHIGDPSRLCEFDFLGGPRPPGEYDDRAPVPSTAEAATGRLRTGWHQLQRTLTAVDDDASLERSWQWSFGETTGWQHIALMLNEVSHHGTQVCELRDLYRLRNKIGIQPA